MEDTKRATIEVVNKFPSESKRDLVEAGIIDENALGCCVYPDINNPGSTLCGDNWSEFMCQQAGGTFFQGQKCSDQE